MKIKTSKCLSRMEDQFRPPFLSIMNLYFCLSVYFVPELKLLSYLCVHTVFFMLNLLKVDSETKSMYNHIRAKCLIKIYKQKAFSFA